jgi:cell fate regulator YaaT (PSP1 superfamily)
MSEEDQHLEDAPSNLKDESVPPVSVDAPPPAAAPEAPRPAKTYPVMMVAGVRLRPGGRVVACDASNFSLRVGMHVIVQIDRGPEVGIVTVGAMSRPVRGRLARIVRIAEERDLDRSDNDGQRANDALKVAREAVAKMNISVKMFHAEVQGGNGGRATFYFASDARVDFRDLVRDLGNRLRLRVELRQVGVRDEAKMVGGIGSCGRELCCTTFLPRFAPVSIKAAKVQNIALTPAKVSGQCGRLKCCLVYEEANYVEAAKSLPRMGKRVETPDGVGRVGDLDVLRGRVRVLFQDQPPKVYEGSQVKPASLPPGGGNDS